MNNPDFNWASLETDVIDGVFSPETKTPRGKDAKVVKFPCPRCSGTGRDLRYKRTTCFACKGEGHFMTSERDRQEAKQKRVESKTQNLTNARKAFDTENSGVAEFLVKASGWSTFAASLVESLNQYGSLTEPQLQAVHSMQAKVEAANTKRSAEREAAKQEVDLSPIRAMFESAVKSGYKRPTYRAAGLVINRAPDSGRNPGALYVKDAETDEYLGKICGTSYTGKPATALVAIAADPKGEAIRYGQRTGTCSCCGRELTKEASIEAGIGPICASKWGL